MWFIVNYCIFVVIKYRPNLSKMSDKKDISFERPDTSGIKLCYRHGITYVNMLYITIVLLCLIFNKKNIDDFIGDQNIVYKIFTCLSCFFMLSGVVYSYVKVLKTHKYYVPWDTILFSWAGIIVLLFIITCL